MSTSSEWERIKLANAVRREREIAERQAAAKELQLNATQETLRQRQVRVVDELLERGKLTDEQRRAAIEICKVWEAITCGLRTKVQNYQPTIKGSGFEDWRASTLNAYHDRYIPWRNEAGAMPVHGLGNLTVADLVFKMAVDNYGVRQVADSYRMDQRTVLNMVRNSLFRYAEIGGWVDVCGQPKIQKIFA
jgi:hypothetical protein